MGFRYRQSINIGKFFRINLSKSGIGYSYGVKGYRITKTAKGSKRTTISIPGTGLSYVHEESNRANQKTYQNNNQQLNTNYYNIRNVLEKQQINNTSEWLNKIASSANRILKCRKIVTNIFFIILGLGLLYHPFLFLALLFAIILIIITTCWKVNLNYDIDENLQKDVENRLYPIIKITESMRIWKVTQTYNIIDNKYSGGATSSINRVVCTKSTRALFPFETNIQVASFQTRDDALIFLPDSLIIMQKDKVYVLSYDDITIDIHTTRFIESEFVPRDSEIVGTTWKYINRSGGPDRRFNDNKQLPICRYGELEINSKLGLHITIMFSNPN